MSTARLPLGIHLATKWWVTVAVTLGMLMSIMDSTIVNVAVPTLRAAFGADMAGVQWVVTVYMLTQAAVIPTATFLTARFGAKRTYVGTLAAFLAGSALCGLAWDLPSLVFFRLVQGIGGGVLLPMVMILLYRAFPIEERGTASSAMGVPLMAAPLLGPVLGGYLVAAHGWPWAFFINLPLGAAALAIAQRVLPPDSPDPAARLDLPGFLTVSAGSVALLYGVSAATGGAAGPGALALGAAAALLAAFVALELRALRAGRAPLLDLRRLRDRTFGFSVLALICQNFGAFGLIFLIPIYLQSLRGQSPMISGAIQAASAVATLLVLPFAGRLSDRIGPKPVAAAGLAGTLAAASLMLTLALDTPLPLFAGLLALMGAAGALAGQTQVSALSRIPNDRPQDVADASTLVSVLRATAAPLGVAMLSSLAQARQAAHQAELAARGAGGADQAWLLAMHDSFAVAALAAAVALTAMLLVPGRRQPQGGDTR